MGIDRAVARAPHRQAAHDAVVEAGRPPMVFKNYALAVRQLTMLIQRHGLGQALAGLQLRGEGRAASPYILLARQLDRWLLASLGVSDRTALGALTSRDSRFYREATELAGLFVRALREAVEEPR